MLQTICYLSSDCNKRFIFFFVFCFPFFLVGCITLLFGTYSELIINIYVWNGAKERRKKNTEILATSKEKKNVLLIKMYILHEDENDKAEFNPNFHFNSCMHHYSCFAFGEKIFTWVVLLRKGELYKTPFISSVCTMRILLLHPRTHSHSVSPSIPIFKLSIDRFVPQKNCYEINRISLCNLISTIFFVLCAFIHCKSDKYYL